MLVPDHTAFDIRFSALDVKLGLRMLRKYPGLSLVSVIGMSVAIAIGASAFGAIATIMNPALPLDEGDRVVSIRNWDTRANEPNPRALHDFLLWKSELAPVRDLGAFRTDDRNLLVADAAPQLVRVAEMTASGFRLARVSPVLGRPLLDEDEREGAPPVVVIAYDEWQRRFNAAPDILGRAIRLGGTVHTVVGVMPEGFHFPINHRYWIPLSLNASTHARGTGPSIFVFGRLANGATREGAQAALTTIGLRVAAAFPETHEHLRPRITPYTYPFLGIDSPAMAWTLRSFVIAVSMLLVLAAVNVAILVYARTAARTGEIAVRTALGASRRRIVAQLFVEALALSLLAAAVGLAIAGVGLAAGPSLIYAERIDQLPFWLDFGLSAELVAYVTGLAIAAAVIVGVLPGLKATGRRVQTSLQQLSSRGSQVQLGRTWTALIVAQVAVAVGVLPFAGYVTAQSLRRAAAEAGYAADEFLRTRLAMQLEDAPPNADATVHARSVEARFQGRAGELVRRLEAEPSVSGVTFVSHLPGYPYARIEGESGRASWAFVNRTDVDLFDVFDIPILAGRGFVDADSRDGAKRVIVNRVFAERVFGSDNVLGRRIRYAGGNAGGESGDVAKRPWFEIVGVVPDFTIQGDLEPPEARLYEPVALADIAPGVTLSLRIRGTAAPTFARRFREISAAVDPALQLHDVRSAADAERQARRGLGLIAAATAAVTLSVVLLSAAGIYAMMSFTVARRRREIGIRSALGADARHLLTGIFARASAQLGAGVLVGLVLAAVVGGPLAVGSGPLEGNGLVMLPLVAALMMVVGLLAALGPARRGLSIQPTEALREE
jgi:predicted permease